MIILIQKQLLIKMVSVKITGLKELNGLVNGLGRNLMKELNKESEKFMKDVRKSAKLRAPKNTGELRRSILLKKEGKNRWLITVESPYGVYQEEGFKPHFIHRSMISGNEGESGFVFVKKHTPFILPALEHNLNKLAQRTSEAVNKSVGISR